MTDAVQNKEILVAYDGTPLKQQLAKTTRRMRIKAFLLTLPLVLFLLVSFVFPIGDMLLRSVNNPAGSNVVPNFAEVIQDWDGNDYPPDETIKVFVEDLALARKNREVGKTVGNLATRVNYEIPGSRSLFTKTGRKADKITEGPYLDALIAIDKKWANKNVWTTLKLLTRD